MKSILKPWLICLAILFLSQVTRAANDFPCPIKHGQWELFPDLSDEFNGNRLDDTKWFPNNPGWLGRQPGYFNPKNVRIDGGMLHLDAKKETLENLPKGYHTFTTAFVKSRKLVRYGYFEIRAQAMDSQASSAFWFYNITPEIWSEIDVFEIGARTQPHNYYMNTHLFHTLVETFHWHKSQIWKAPYNLAKEFHIYGFEWDPDTLRYYVDGTMVREEKNSHWHQPLALCFDSETFPTWFGLPKDDALPATFSIDYCRVWKRKDGPPILKPETVEFYFPSRSNGKETDYNIKALDGGVLLIKATGGSVRPERVKLEYQNDAYFGSETNAEIHKEVRIKDNNGKILRFVFEWSKTEPWKRQGRSAAGEAPGKIPSPIKGYYAVGIGVYPENMVTPGHRESYEFLADDKKTVRVNLTQ